MVNCGIFVLKIPQFTTTNPVFDIFYEPNYILIFNTQ